MHAAIACLPPSQVKANRFFPGLPRLLPAAGLRLLDRSTLGFLHTQIQDGWSRLRTVTSAEMRKERVVRASEGATAKDGHADGTNSLFIGDADVAALRFFLDGHLRDDRNSHSRADHAEEAAELSTPENDLGVEARAVAGGNGRIAETVAITQEPERLSPQILERKRGARVELVLSREHGEELLRQ